MIIQLSRSLLAVIRSDKPANKHPAGMYLHCVLAKVRAVMLVPAYQHYLQSIRP